MGGQPWDEALDAYAKRRDSDTAEGWRLTLSAASLRPLSPRLERRLTNAAGRPDEVSRIIGALGGVIPADEVFSV